MPDDSTEELKARAEAEKLAADAAKARAEAEKLAAEAQKTRAEAAKAAADAAKVEAENAAASSATAAAAREAERSKELAEAERDAAAARVEQIGALIPDLDKVKSGSLTVEGGPLHGTALAVHALDECATAVVKDVGDAVSAAGGRFLVTSDPDLVGGYLRYLEIARGIEQLIDAADAILKESTDHSEELRKVVATDASLAVLGAISQAIPAVLSAFSSERSIETTPTSVTDLAAAASVVAALHRQSKPAPEMPDGDRLASGVQADFVHAAFRTVPAGGQLNGRLDNLSTARRQLVEAAMRAARAKTVQQVDLAAASNALAVSNNKLAVAKATQPRDEAAIMCCQEEVNASKAKVETAQTKLETTSMIGDRANTLVSSIDAFTTAINVVPSGGTRSPLGIALLHEHLTPQLKNPPDPNVGNQAPAEASGPFTHALLIKAGAGDVTQVVENRWAWLADRWSAEATLVLTFMCLDLRTNTLIAAGSVARSAVAYGAVAKGAVVTVKEAGGR